MGSVGGAGDKDKKIELQKMACDCMVTKNLYSYRVMQSVPLPIRYIYAEWLL